MAAEYRSQDQEEIYGRLNRGEGHFRGDTLTGLNLAHGSSPEFSAAGCRCMQVSFSGRQNNQARLTDSLFRACRFDRSGWRGLQIEGGRWEECDCREASFVRSRLQRWEASSTVFQNADFQGAHLVDCRFINCEFFGAQCQDAVFIRTAFGTDNFLGRNDFQRADLSRTLLVDVDLSGTDFSGADLQGAIFVRSNLAQAVFQNANLTGALFLGCRK